MTITQSIDFEGAEMIVYFNGEEIAIPLSDTQFAVCAKLLGLKLQSNGDVSCYADSTIKQFLTLSTNPLRLQEQ